MSQSLDLLDPDAYARDGYPWQAWAELRRHHPVSKRRHGESGEYWAIVRHGDVVAISRRPHEFLSAPRLNMPPRRVRPGQSADFLPETIITMDPPRHAAYRALTSRHFTPRALSAFEPRIAALAGEIVSRALERFGDGREFDFVDEVSARLPLAVIMELLGVPRADWETLLRLANQTVGAGDPEYNAGGDVSTEVARAATKTIFEHYASYIAERRARPRDDLMSVLVQVELGGRRLEDHEVLGYCFLLTAAGNETTRNATSGGMLALLEHPAQLARLRAERGWLRGADEIVRWVSPISHVCRPATSDAEVGGERIRAGETVTLFYPSAARDESAFASPESFDVGRAPNPHVSFGIGEHYCLGARLARLELAAIVREWVTRVAEFECSRPIERLRSIVIGGIKHMPVRISPARR